MRKTILALTAAATLGTGIAVATTATAEAAPAPKLSSSNCISPSEKSNLRLGMTTQQVNKATKAHPWFRTTESIDGTRYAVYAYNDCRTNSGKVVGVAYRVAYDGTQHLALTRYLSL